MHIYIYIINKNILQAVNTIELYISYVYKAYGREK